MVSPRKKLAELVASKQSDDVSDCGTRTDVSVALSSVKGDEKEAKKTKKAKKAKKAKKPKKVVVSSSEESSEFDEDEDEGLGLLDQRFIDLTTQERAKIRSLRSFYVDLPAIFRKVDKEGSGAFMAQFEMIKDLLIDFRDISESNKQYEDTFNAIIRCLG